VKDLRKKIQQMVEHGRRAHYADAVLYDHEYRRRRDDIVYYEAVAAQAETRRILELGCGTGRITAPLVKAGYEVVGVDFEPTMLRQAEARLAKLPATARARASLHRADFRALALGEKFGLVICPFNAVMHLYTRPSLEAFLDGVRRHLRPGGWFVFDLLMPDLRWLSRDPTKRWARTRFRDPTTGIPMVYSTNHWFDEARQICFMRIYYEPLVAGACKPHTVELTHRYFFPEELRALLHYNGFTVEKHFRDFNETDYDDAGGGDQQIVWCKRSTSRSTRR